MALKDVHESLEEIPEQYRELYTDKNGRYELTGIAGVKTTADLERVQNTLRREREEHKATREKLAAWSDLDPEDVMARLDRLPELEAAAKGKLDDAKIEELVEQRLQGTLKSRTAPLEREAKGLREKLEEVTREAEELRAEKTRRAIHDEVRKAAKGAKIVGEAEEDVLLLADRVFEVDDEGHVVTRDGVGVTPGMDAASWITEIQPRRPHWWPPAQGGGARGSGGSAGFPGGSNPWSADSWSLTRQGEYLKQHGQEKAMQAAKAAGTALGGPRPAPARQGG